MEDKLIIYNTVFTNEDGSKEDRVAIIVPSPKCGLTLEQIAKKDVPTGNKYKIVNRSFLPSDRDFRNAWEISESELTDGVGD